MTMRASLRDYHLPVPDGRRGMGLFRDPAARAASLVRWAGGCVMGLGQRDVQFCALRGLAATLAAPAFGDSLTT